MAIVEFSFKRSDVPANAVRVQEHTTKAGCLDGTTVDQTYWTWHTHVGLCLSDHESNGSYDSDFCMVVWNEKTDAPTRITYATTRGWSYPSYASFADATDEVKAKYAAWQAMKAAEYRTTDRKNQAAKLRQERSKLRAAAGKHGFSFIVASKRLRQLRKADAIQDLLTRNIRGKFNVSLRDRIVAWLKDPNPAYRTPLSPRQLEWI